MNFDLPKNYTEDQDEFDYWKYENLREENEEPKFDNFSNMFNSPNFINYETNEEFLENFLKIATPKNQELNNFREINEFISTGNTSKSNNINQINNLNQNEIYDKNQLPINFANEEEEFKFANKTEKSQLIGNKKGRPMQDKDIIYDEINQKFYDPSLDLIEYKKARK